MKGDLCVWQVWITWTPDDAVSYSSTWGIWVGWEFQSQHHRSDPAAAPIQPSSPSVPPSTFISCQLSTVSKWLQMLQNTEECQTLKSRTDNLKEREVEAGDKPSAVGHTIYLTIIAAIRSRSGPEEMAVMIDKASSWGKLHKVWVNSLFYGLRCSVPMGTLYQGPMGLSDTAAQLTNSSYSQHTHCFIFRDFNYAANGNHLRPLTVYIMICVRSLIRKRLVRASRGVNIGKTFPNKCWCSINSAARSAVCWRTLWGDVTSVLIAYFHKKLFKCMCP